MITSKYVNMNDSPLRRIKGKVELYNNSTLSQTFSYDDNLQEITIERTGDKGKFFGFGVCQKLTMKVFDRTGALDIPIGQNLIVKFSAAAESDYIRICPEFIISTVERNETGNIITVSAYDALDAAAKHAISEITLTVPYTIKTVCEAISSFLGLSSDITDSSFDTEYNTGANLSGNETLREILDAAAEATQTIYYVDHEGKLVFKHLDVAGDAVYTINKNAYFSLQTKTPLTLNKICNSTELGDNVEYGYGDGAIQYIHDNPFWELRDDIATLVNDALEAVGDMTINQFECNWRGCLALEPGDKIKLITKDNKSVISYVLNDTLTYNGGLTQKTQWNYTESENTESNATSLGEVLKQTYARVDKANKQIELLAGEVDANNNAISSIMVNTDSILSSVQRVETATQESLDSIHKDVNTLTSKVEAQLTAEDVKLEIKSELANGVDKVETNTGFTFNDEGLTISKTGSEMTTQITEDGMTVNRDNEEMLTANNEGVIAVNLHAKTYLIIGGTSRFEDYQRDGETRTGCFWIGDTGV